MKINGIIQGAYSKDIHTKNVDNKKKNNPKSNDKIEISEEARNLQKSTTLQIKARSSIREIDEIKNSRIEEIRKKLENGFYFKNEVSKIIVENIMKNLGIE